MSRFGGVAVGAGAHVGLVINPTDPTDIAGDAEDAVELLSYSLKCANKPVEYKSLPGGHRVTGRGRELQPFNPTIPRWEVPATTNRKFVRQGEKRAASLPPPRLRQSIVTVRTGVLEGVGMPQCPLWVKKRTLKRLHPMSALPSEADIS